MLSTDDVKRFERDGYLIVRNVFSTDEIGGLRDAVDGLVERLPSGSTMGDAWTLPGDLAAFSELAPLVVDPRLLEIARALLRDRPIYFRDSAISVAQTPGNQVRGWHKDNRVPDRFDPLTPDWEGDYPVIRMGLYCQDHRHHSGGLGVRAGSHRLRHTLARRLLWGAVHRLRPRAGVRAHQYGITSGRAIHADTAVGDLVVWTLRTSHTGFSLRPRVAKNLKLSPRLEARLPSRMFRPWGRRRMLIAITYGAESAHLERLVEFLPTRDYFRERNLARPVCDAGLSAFARQADAVVLREPGDVAAGHSHKEPIAVSGVQRRE